MTSMKDVFVGIDVAKSHNAIVVADSERSGQAFR
jgi:hypothetical protein